MRRIPYDSVTVSIFSTEDRQTAFILALWLLIKSYEHMGSSITISLCVRGFLLSSSSSFALNLAPPLLSVAWKPKNAPRRDVRLNDVNWRLVVISPLGNSGYQTKRNTTKWEQNRSPHAFIALRARQNFKLAFARIQVNLTRFPGSNNNNRGAMYHGCEWLVGKSRPFVRTYSKMELVHIKIHAVYTNPPFKEWIIISVTSHKQLSC